MSTVTNGAQSIGMVSPLLEKVESLDLSIPLDLERLAVLRGCDYYTRSLVRRVPPFGDVPLSNAELAIALLSPLFRPTAREIRLAAALLGAPDVQPEAVSTLAIQDGCVAVVRHIALSGKRFEPGNPFWLKLLDLLPEVIIETDHLPHPTRFVEMTGIDRGKVGVFARWIRPRQSIACCSWGTFGRG